MHQNSANLQTISFSKVPHLLYRILKKLKKEEKIPIMLVSMCWRCSMEVTWKCNKRNWKSSLEVFLQLKVGGWAQRNVDPAQYPRSLVKYLHEYITKNEDDRSSGYSFRLLDYAASKSRSVTGSSTACIVTLNQTGKYDTANLGVNPPPLSVILLIWTKTTQDSGFMILRNNELFYRSQEQQHAFNFPFQIGTDSKDHANHAYRADIEAKPGE